VRERLREPANALPPRVPDIPTELIWLRVLSRARSWNHDVASEDIVLRFLSSQYATSSHPLHLVR